MNSLCSFYTFEALKELIAPNLIGNKEANENLKTINRFNGFYSPIYRALNFHFLIELAKLFDDAKQSLHLQKLISFAKSNKGKMTANDFKNANQDRKFIEELSKRYNGLNRKDFEQIEKMLRDNEKLINKLTLYRDQNLAHEDKNKKDITISVEEVTLLFEIISNILNIFSSKIDFSTTVFNNIKEEAKRDTKIVVDHLKRFEKYRLLEIRERSISGKI